MCLKLIGISGSTKLLLIKRDFQCEYEKQIADCNSLNHDLSKAESNYLTMKRLNLYHQVF